MPFLDFSDIVLDPDLADHFVVYRRPASINVHGRTVTRPLRIPDVIGVVTNAHPSDLQRLDDQQRMQRVLSVVTKFPLRGPASGFQPDYVIWRGDSYLVIEFQPYPQYGSGFYQALVASQDIMDKASPGIGQFDYSVSDNSDYIPLG